MRPLTTWICLLAVCFVPWPNRCPADEIILKSGERFTSDRIWKENGKIRFNMQGLLVSVSPADVAAINRPGTGALSPAPEKATAPPTPHRPPGPPRSKPMAGTAAKSNRPGQSRPDNPRIKGIGIDGIQWQMPPSDIPGLKKGKTEPAYGGIDQYHRTQGRLRMGDALLDGLVFAFWQNRLYTITIWVDGKPAYERLRQAVIHRHGKGRKSKSGLERYIWMEDTTDRMLEFDDKLNTGIFWMRSRELDRHLTQRYPNS